MSLVTVSSARPVATHWKSVCHANLEFDRACRWRDAVHFGGSCHISLVLVCSNKYAVQVQVLRASKYLSLALVLGAGAFRAMISGALRRRDMKRVATKLGHLQYYY